MDFRIDLRKKSFLRQLFEKSINEIYIFHPKSLKFFAVNQAARKNLGFSSEDLSNMTPVDLNPEMSVDRFKRLLEPLIKGEKGSISFQTKHRRKDGTLYPVEVNLQLISYRGKNLCIAFISDITERVLIEDEMQEAQLKFDVVINSVWDAIVIIDDQDRVTFWNKAAEKLFGYSWEEVIWKKLDQFLVPGSYYKPHIGTIKHNFLEGKGNSLDRAVEMKARNKDGREVFIEVSLSIFNFKDNWYSVGIARDISEQKKLEEENKIKEDRPRLMLGGLPTPAWLITKNKKILAQNKMAEKLFHTKVNGYCWEEIHKNIYIQKTNRDVYENTSVPLPDTKCYFCKADEALLRNESINIEVELEDKVWDTWWIPLGGDIYLHYANDVTAYKNIEKELYLLSVTDPLTSIYNRRYFLERLDEEIERIKRTSSKFSVIMLDIDNFKSINDKFGHNAGDLVLKSLSETIKDRIRKIDIFARWGGEEFVILLPETTPQKASILAEEIRVRLSNLKIEDINGITVSCGIAGSRQWDSVDSLIERADNLMYEAKAVGKNCVRYEE
ncbi:diguanylate cyclase [Thermodesulfobium sp. 4217-1]|uniref:sensor domain-containing diguanylate cyclase n=1 Tax=Thermodesulfobium sp. 4217-1 TaxID=3120013 RepID=UPI003221A6A5